MVILEITLLLVRHCFPINLLTACIHRVRVSICHHVPQISIMCQKEAFNYVFPVIKILSIKDWRFAAESVSVLMVVIASV